MYIKFCATSLIVATVLNGSVEAWKESKPQDQMPKMQGADSPFNSDQSWFMKESYLLMRVHQDDVDGAVRFSSPEGESKTNANVYLTTMDPKFEWGNGVRIEIGKYLSSYHLWDVKLGATYYYNSSHKTKTVNFTDTFLEPLWDTNILGSASEAVLKWKMNYFTWDLLIGRAYSLTSQLTLHPFIGAGAFLITQKYLNNFESRFGFSSTFFEEGPAKFKARNHVWGVGPEVGTNFNYLFAKEWAILGDFTAAFFYSNYTIKESISGYYNALEFVFRPTVLKMRDRATAFRSNLHGSFGLGWEKWVSRHRIRINPTIMFEATHWFGINNWVSIQDPPYFNESNEHAVDLNRHYGDLDLYGFTFNLQIDF